MSQTFLGLGIKLAITKLETSNRISVCAFFDIFSLKLLHPNFIHLFKKQSFMFKNSVANCKKAVPSVVFEPKDTNQNNSKFCAH